MKKRFLILPLFFAAAVLLQTAPVSATYGGGHHGHGGHSHHKKHKKHKKRHYNGDRFKQKVCKWLEYKANWIMEHKDPNDPYYAHKLQKIAHYQQKYDCLPDPEPDPLTLTEQLQELGNFTTILGAFDETGLLDELDENSTYTFFIPTDEAFDNLDPDVADDILLNPKTLTDILSHHITDPNAQPDGLSFEDVTSLASLAMLGGESAGVQFVNGVLTVGGAEVTIPDIEISNGVMHVVDNVMIP